MLHHCDKVYSKILLIIYNVSSDQCERNVSICTDSCSDDDDDDNVKQPKRFIQYAYTKLLQHTVLFSSNHS
jgi:hypothetical protein